MAQASMATLPVATGAALQPSTVLSEDELRQIHEYDRVVQFRDAVLSGSHPHIKPPAQFGATKAQSNMQTSSSLGGLNGETSGSLKPAHVHDYRLDNSQSFRANSQQSAIASSATGGLVNFAKDAVAGAAQFDPLLLTKSDVLVRAELQQQRQRIEKALREELEQRPEQEADLDLPDILAKALTLVQATAPPADAELAANSSDSSDSFDNNTFYSSQHDTPEPHLSSPRAHSASEDVPMRETTTSAPRIQVHDENSRAVNTQQAGKASTSLITSNNVAHQNHLVQNTQPYMGTADTASFAGLMLQGQAPAVYSQYGVGNPSEGRMPAGDQVQPMVISSNGSGSTSRSDDRYDADGRAGPKQHRQAGLVAPREPPFIRSHDLQPYAPQPAHVSPLATSRQPAMPDPEISILPGAPPQVAALRQEAGNGTSPESSPQGEKGSKKKNNKKKNKRKTAAERPASPFIKPEPRSPSPLSAPQYSRPTKRQRPLLRQQELNYDEPRRPQSVEVIHDDYDPRVTREERLPAAVGYERAIEDAYGRPVRQSVAASNQRFDLPVYEDRGLDEPIQYVRRAPEPSSYAVPYTPSEAHLMRSATYSVADTPYREPIAYYPEGRMSVRPGTDRARSRSPARAESRSATTMGPPRPPTRIIRDQFGREYIEPPPMRPVSRLSAAPPGRPLEHEVIYERLPVSGTFEQDGVIYRRASPVPAQRRVVTQPDYGAVDYRGYRQRDYSIHSVPPPVPGHEYLQYRGTEERRLPPEPPQEYAMRSSSVRPQEPIWYEYPRVQSIRPSEVPVREYAASIHPEPRREVVPPTYREYSVRPTELDMPRREYSVRPMEQRYYERPVLRDDEVAYIEPPRTVQREIVYEDGRREVCR
ncbi:hypothetical protein PG994_013113 [Apiospora phragmitis]|uniref:Uncharacterized protein n=1 Tax=Apiospora phragmitis TaxID=2905665 RepID=A0ABR1T7Q4_9PEZI